MLGMVMIFVVAGVLTAGLSAFMPWQIMQIFTMMFGLLIAMVGMIMLITRATKTGAVHLLKTAQPHKMLWFYIQKDGQVFITPAFRRAEGMTQSEEMNAIVQDLKSYRLHDHQIRFVPEGIGHTADVKNVLYATVMKSKYGFEGIRDGRSKIFWWLKKDQQEKVGEPNE